MTYTLDRFGSYYAGGRIEHVTEGEIRTINFTPEATFDYDPRGHFVVERAYVQWYRPAKARDLPPIVLVHGGGLHGAIWETTPDGRPGWLHGLLDMGREVHVVDMVERGRAGWVPDLWDERPVLRSMEEGWFLFRIGPEDGYATRRPFRRCLFPTGAFEALAASFCPRWLTTGRIQARALGAVLEKVIADHGGPAEVICHSQGAEAVFGLEDERPHLFAGVRAVEPSFRPPRGQLAGGGELVLIAGDNLDAAPHWVDRAAGWKALSKTRYIDTVADLRPGGTHMMMMDSNSADVLALLMS